MAEVLTKIVVNCETGVTEELPLTAEEIAQREADAAAWAVEQAAREAEAAQIAADKQAAIDALVALGLTEAQIAALSK